VNTSDDILVESFSALPARLRIAVVTETYAPEINGVAMTLGRIVEGLIRRGHTVELVRPRQPLEGAPALRDGLDQVLSRGVPLPSYGELQFGMPAERRLIKLWSARRPDVVHVATEGPLGWSAVAAARTLQLPTTSSFHTNFDSYSQHYGMGLLKSPIDTYLRKLHNRTLATMVPTQALVQALHARGYQHVTLLSRGVDTALFQPAKRSQALRQSWGVQRTIWWCCWWGAWPRKRMSGRCWRRLQPCASTTPTRGWCWLVTARCGCRCSRPAPMRTLPVCAKAKTWPPTTHRPMCFCLPA